MEKSEALRVYAILNFFEGFITSIKDIDLEGLIEEIQFCESVIAREINDKK